MKVKEITIALFQEFEQRGLKYCVYNGYENLPGLIKSDLDIAIEENGLSFLDLIIYDLARKHGFLLLHKIWHQDKKISYVISPLSSHTPERLQFDFFSEFSSRDYKGRNSWCRFHLIDEAMLLSDCRRNLYFNVPQPYREFLMKFLRRVLKEDLDENRFEKITKLYFEAPEKCNEELHRYFPKNAAVIIDTIEHKDISKLMLWLPRLKMELRRFAKFDIRKLFSLGRRAINRIRYPVGMTFAFLGVDGSGKSSLARALMRSAAVIFPAQDFFYWRPSFLKQPGIAFGLRDSSPLDGNPDPHGHSPENLFRSLLRFLYYLIDFTFGYLVKVWPLKVKKHLCVFDRYYYDAIIDSFRYNFSLPRWLLRLPILFIPKPDVTIVLDLSVEELLRRKKELPDNELRRQRAAFLSLARGRPDFYIVNNSIPMGEVIKEIISIILIKKSYQTHLSLNLTKKEEQRYLMKLREILKIKEGNDHGKNRLIAFPRYAEPRIFLAADNYGSFESSLDLYTPNRLLARILCKVIPSQFLYFIFKNSKSNHFHMMDTSILDKIRNIFPSATAFSIYTGAPGPHRKPSLLVLNKEGETLGYMKLSLDHRTHHLLNKEREVLEFVKRNFSESVFVPEIKKHGVLLNNLPYLSTKSIKAKYSKAYNLSHIHSRFLNEIYRRTTRKLIFANSELYKDLQGKIDFLEGKIPFYWTSRYKRILEYYTNKIIPISFSHGDFTPWNAFILDTNQLLLFDWEYSRYNFVLADLFHFIINREVFSLSKGGRLKGILHAIDKKVNLFFPEFKNRWKDLISLFLFEESSFYFFRNIVSNYVEKDLRMEITWFNLLTLMMERIVNDY